MKIIECAIDVCNQLVGEGKIESKFDVHEALIFEMVGDHPIVTVKVSVRVGENRIK